MTHSTRRPPAICAPFAPFPIWGQQQPTFTKTDIVLRCGFLAARGPKCAWIPSLQPRLSVCRLRLADGGAATVLAFVFVSERTNKRHHHHLSPALPPPPQSTHLLRILCRLYGHFFLGCVVLAVFSFAASPSPGVPSRLPSSHAARARTSPLSRPAAAAVHLSLSRPSQVTHGRNG